MEYRRLGSTGLRVSVIGFDNGIYSEDHYFSCSTNKMVKKAWELGINYFDTAEVYGDGKAERYLGKALKELNVQRQDIVLCTKIYFGALSEQKFPNTKFLSRKHIIESVKQSLKRLDTPYIDLIVAHRYDPDTPLEEICRAFDWLIQQGLALYWGTSGWTTQKITQAIGICNKLNLKAPTFEQPEYSILERDNFEWELSPLFNNQFGATIWSPLYQGLLNGKDNRNILADSRFKDSINPLYKDIYANALKYPQNGQIIQSKLKQLKDLAASLKITPLQLVLVWALKNKDVNSILTSALDVDQLEEVVKSINTQQQITSQVEQQIESILQNKPQTNFDHKNMKMHSTRRDIYV